MSDVEWTNELVIRLMMEYRKRPELWDGSHDLYRVHTAKYEAWSELAGLFECDIVDLRKKLNSIFASHRREKAKVRCGGRSGWFLYPHMGFLPTHVPGGAGAGAGAAPSERRRRIPNPPDELPQSSAEDEVDDEDVPKVDELDVTIKTEPVAEYPKLKTRRVVKYASCRRPRLAKLVKRKVIKENHNEEDRNGLAETMRPLRRSDLLKKKDECDSFGEYIADSLRKHDERTQAMIKQAINNILFEQEMKKYSTGHYAVLPPGIDENPLTLSKEHNEQ